MKIIGRKVSWDKKDQWNFSTKEYGIRVFGIVENYTSELLFVSKVYASNGQLLGFNGQWVRL